MYQKWNYDSVKFFIMGFVKVIESIIYIQVAKAEMGNIKGTYL